ncbi:hypothetical protein CMI41_04285 [Candidatus Pacearchaeota archaeon]|nr:hypothetical protein [Candidatus Pacearchaeota archaeon]|tara:strand:- start:6246 stop:6695 length:450 start_codon:yes stop_codon:yes gene_type:complete
MGSYTTRVLENGLRYLVVDGVVFAPELQRKGLFSKITNAALTGSEGFVCLRTQNPRMFRALENLCSITVGARENLRGIFEKVREDLVDYFGCETDPLGVIKGYYGGLFYGERPEHKEIDPLFSELGVDLDKGDALLAIGDIRVFNGIVA